MEAPRDKEQMGTGFGIPLLQSQEKIPKAWGKKKINGILQGFWERKKDELND